MSAIVNFQGTLLTINRITVSNQGYGHKLVSIELLHNGNTLALGVITSNLPAIDAAEELDYEDSMIALYNIVAHCIIQDIEDWMIYNN